jgi:hypothetical protein
MIGIKLWKESFNIDGHQFHQDQQNEQSPLILTELTEHDDDISNKIQCVHIWNVYNNSRLYNHLIVYANNGVLIIQPLNRVCLITEYWLYNHLIVYA